MINRDPKLTQYHSISCKCTGMEMLAARTARWHAIVATALALKFIYNRLRKDSFVVAALIVAE